jgi:sodium-dependent dicarboxylate transporter 2/3/5
MASVTMLLPILGETAHQLDMRAWDLMVPATLAASCAFMLPVATAPNAIAYSTGRVQMWDMIRAGFLLNIIGVVLVVLWMQVV